MTDDLLELEKQFIIEEDLEIETIKQLIQRIIKFARIDKRGFVAIQVKDIPIPQKLMLVFSSRFLANRLQQKIGKESFIKDELCVKELSDMLRVKEAVISARLKELKDDNKIIPTSKGCYKVNPSQIESFLKILEVKTNE